jgi:hypothetical protein
MAAVDRNIVDIDLRSSPASQAAVVALVGTWQCPALIDLERLPRIEHRRRRQISGHRRPVHVCDIDHRHCELRPVYGAVRGPVVGAFVHAVFEFRRLPLRAVASNLTDELQIAAELVVVFIASCCLVIDSSMIRSVGEFRSTRFHSLNSQRAGPAIPAPDHLPRPKSGQKPPCAKMLALAVQLIDLTVAGTSGLSRIRAPAGM